MERMIVIQLYDSYGLQSEILIFEGLATTCAINSWINESSLPITTTSFEKDPETDLVHMHWLGLMYFQSQLHRTRTVRIINIFVKKMKLCYSESRI